VQRESVLIAEACDERRMTVPSVKWDSLQDVPFGAQILENGVHSHINHNRSTVPPMSTSMPLIHRLPTMPRAVRGGRNAGPLALGMPRLSDCGASSGLNRVLRGVDS
jgi:hypothetical protein